MIDMGLNFGLGTLPLLSDAQTRSISAENPTGEPGAGGREASNLGVGRKGRPCITVPAGQTVSLADVSGAGVIQHIWITMPGKADKMPYAYRDLVLRFYWDGESTPSVETPIGDFFAMGHNLRCRVNSVPVSVNPTGGMNCYWPMPFRRSARVTVENQGVSDLGGFFYQISYALVPKLPDEAAFFHAQWRRSNPNPMGEDHVLLDSVRGRGHYVGSYLAWTPLSNGWWGEGEIKFFIDGDREFPTICGTGSEDYVGGAWCFGETYGGPYLGYPLQHHADGEVRKVSIYRWHVLDPVRFRESLKVTIQQIGYGHEGLYERADDVASVAYWYQTEPHAPLAPLPALRDRWPR
jgi:hypothetical protein